LLEKWLETKGRWRGESAMRATTQSKDAKHQSKGVQGGRHK
jgi:hypothetical protein